MSSAVRDRAYGRLFTTKVSGNGSGLGLAAVRRFARDSGGCVSVHSAEGMGTSVWIYVPCPEASDARERCWREDPAQEAAPDSAV
jgi:signal transduction histidine kinase